MRTTDEQRAELRRSIDAYRGGVVRITTGTNDLSRINAVDEHGTVVATFKSREDAALFAATACGLGALLDDVDELRAQVSEYASALYGYTEFLGPCVHGRDPWDRCDECGEGSAVQALQKVADALRERMRMLEAENNHWRAEAQTNDAKYRGAVEASGVFCNQRDAALKRIAELEAQLAKYLEA